MKLDDCFELGYIIKPHGIKGGIHIFLDVDDPLAYKNMGTVYIDFNNNLIPYFFSSLEIKGKKAIAFFKDVSNIEEAEELKSRKLYLPLSELPKLKEDQFYYHEVIGYQISDKTMGMLGVLEAIYTKSAQDLFSMKYQGKEVLIPVTDAVFLTVDHKQKILFVDLPEGLVDLYLNP
jgi:16S rRNA processing protein RimM